MKNRSFYIVLLSLLIACTKPEKQKSQLRIGQFMINSRNVEVFIKKKASTIISKKLQYQDLTDYNEIESGTYNIEVFNAGQIILKKEIGIGSDGTYTLIIYGIPVKSQELNQRSTKTKLLEMVQGSEVKSANAYLPQLSILNDEFECGKNEAKIRWVHLVPGVSKVSAKIHDIEQNKNTELSTLKYPDISKNMVLVPGRKKLNYSLDGNEINVASKDINISSSRLYTVFILGKEEHFISNLEIKIATSPKKEF